MTPMPSLADLFDTVRRSLRRETVAAVVFGSLCAIPAALLFAWLFGLLRPWSRPGVGPLVLDLLAIGAAGSLAWFGVRRWLDTLDESAVAADAERTAGAAEGSVRGALELLRSVPEGTSPALARRAGAEIGRRFSGVSPDAVAPGLRRRTRSRSRAAALSLGVLCAATVLLAFVAPDHSRAAWAPLARPVAHLTPPPLPPLAVRPGDAEIPRGADLSVHVTAPGRDAVIVHWRVQGDVPRETLAAVSSDTALAVIPRVDAEGEYWVEAPDGAVTRRYRVMPVDALLLSELSVDVVYPPHVGRTTDHYQGEIPPLEIPEGTQLIVRGRTTRPLSAAALQLAGTGSEAAFAVRPEMFDGAFSPAASGRYEWRLVDAGGSAPAVAPAPIDITVVTDAPPQVDITFPVTDTILDASLRQAVVADARDDYGLSSAVVVSWRSAAAGGTSAPVEEPIALAGDDRVLIRGVLDASERGLVPGDTLWFHIRVTDTSPRRQTAVSRTIALRLPGAAELRERAAESADELVEDAARLASDAARLQQTAHDLERQTSAANARRQAERQRGNRPGGSSEQRMDYQEASAARQLLERQDEMVERLEAMRQDMEALERAMERAGLRDGELQQRLEEMRRLYDEMLTPEMREKLEALRNAVEQLDPQALEKALEQMARQQEEMKEQLDRNLEMMRRAAAEQQLNNLAQEARELATRQEALAESMAEREPAPEQTQAQRDLATQTQKLSESLEEMRERLEKQGEPQTAQSTEEARESATQAGRQMQQAAQDASRKDGAAASERGADAAEQLEQTARTLDQARQAMADAWKQDARDSMEQATQDALSLAERQQQLLERMKQAEQEQSGSQSPQMPQPGQQGQQQSGQQSGQQQQGGQPNQQQSGQQQSQQGQPGQQGGQMPGQGAGSGSGGTDMQGMRSEQGALQQGLQQLGRNLQENRERSAAMNREVGSSLGRANLSMQQTLDAMQQGQLPTDQAQQTVDALNRLALSLLNNSQSLGEQSGEGSQAMQQMADIAKQQGSLNGRTNALTPMDLTPGARSQQLSRMSAEQMEIARRLGELNRGGREGLMGDVDALAREAEEIARQLQSGRMPPETLARQERLFHRMLDAGRSLEKDEVEDERSAERPSRFERSSPDALDPALFRDPTRFRAPDAEELQALPPAYRRLILDYFERLNRTPPAGRVP